MNKQDPATRPDRFFQQESFHTPTRHCDDPYATFAANRGRWTTPAVHKTKPLPLNAAAPFSKKVRI
jgi:hypothetical protein